MHLNRIAHRVGSLFAAYLLYSQSEDFQDICEENIVVNVSGNRGSSGWRSIFPIRYWYIDFEYAVRFPTGARFDDCRVKGLPAERWGRDIAPEAVKADSYDPFAVDVFALGIVFWHLFSVMSSSEVHNCT